MNIPVRGGQIINPLASMLGNVLFLEMSFSKKLSKTAHRVCD